MEFYKLPDLSKEYSLDYYKDTLDGIAVFSYKGKKGRYESRWVNGVLRHMLIIDNVYYALYKEKYLSFNNAFTKDDLSMLMAIANETVIREFPFKLDSGEIVTLRLPGDWLFDLGESILAFDKTTKMFYVKQGILYVDDKPVDVHTISKFYKEEDNVYTYGLQAPRAELCVSRRFKAGCKIEYLQELLIRLPIRSGNYCVNVCYGRGCMDSGLDYITDVDEEVSVIPLNKITNYRLPEFVYDSVNHIKFEVDSIRQVEEGPMQEHKRLILMRGAPGSGKSTLIKNSGLSNYAISLDELRRLLAAEENCQLPTLVNKETYALLYSILQTRVQKGKLIILDAVNASIDHIKESIELAESYGYKVVYFQMQTSLGQCLENNLCRPAYSRASEEKIRKFHEMIEITELPYERIYNL